MFQGNKLCATKNSDQEAPPHDFFHLQYVSELMFLLMLYHFLGKNSASWKSNDSGPRLHSVWVKLGNSSWVLARDALLYNCHKRSTNTFSLFLVARPVSLSQSLRHKTL